MKILIRALYIGVAEYIVDKYIQILQSPWIWFTVKRIWHKEYKISNKKIEDNILKFMGRKWKYRNSINHTSISFFSGSLWGLSEVLFSLKIEKKNQNNVMW